MLDISFKKNPELYRDFRVCLEYLRTVREEDHSYPAEPVNFHIYSEFKTDKEILSLKSFFATQNLDHTRVIVWSDYDIRNEPRVQPFKDLVDFRVWNAWEESIGTPLEGWKVMLRAADQKHYLQSDLLRLLALYKYGGIWIDMDIVLLRDFKLILDQEFLYMWGPETDFNLEGACASVLSLDKKSPLATQMLEEAKRMPIVPNSTCWGKDMFARLHRRWPFPILPATFFNIEWCMSATFPGLGERVVQGWFQNRSNNHKLLFPETFAWHWHNSSKKNLTIEEGSKFDLLTKLTDERLRERGFVV
jgi:hypothetical protein